MSKIIGLDVSKKWLDIVKPIELGDTNFVSYLRKQVSRFPPTRE